MRRIGTLVALAALFAAAVIACDHVSEGDDTNGSDASIDDTDTTPPPLPIDALDIVFVVDDSISMMQEQAILATSVFHLVSNLTTPRIDWPYPAVDDVRFAVVTTNMGFSALGVSGDAFWPGTMPDECSGLGDNGAFQPMQAQNVPIQDGVIPCWGAPGQCPPGWTCAAEGASEDAFCQNPSPGGSVTCPELDDVFTATTADSPNGALALELACLAEVGTDGCGFEQQLSSAVAATQRGDQAWFFREHAGLGVVVASDEDDCSMEDNAGLFATDEIAQQELQKVNMACGLHPEFLRDPASFRAQLAAVKGGHQEAVFFAAIVGTPVTPECQGLGSTIGDCLEQNEMQFVEEQPNAPMDLTWFFHPACTRSIGDEEVTRAYPGRRYVELAQSMGDSSFVYSICNDDWMPAMESFAAILAAAAESY